MCYNMYGGTHYSTHFGTKIDCPDYEVVLDSGAEYVLWHLVPVACVCIRGAFTIQGSGFRGVSAIQGSGLEGCPQFRGLD